MTTAQPLPAADPPDPGADERALIREQIAILGRLTGIGMGIAETSPAAPDPALAFARIARAVRLTLALQARLARTVAGLDSADDLARTVAAAERRERIQQRIERAIEADHDDDDDEVERLCDDAWERLTDIDDADIAAQPVEAVVARIRHDLGLDRLSRWRMGERSGVGVGSATPHGSLPEAPPQFSAPSAWMGPVEPPSRGNGVSIPASLHPP